jgi:hypothetical protein
MPDISPDPARELAGKQATAERPIGGVQSARVNAYADAAGPRFRIATFLEPQNLRWFAEPVEADCPHSADGGRRSAHDTSPGSARVRNGSDIVAQCPMRLGQID